MIRKIFVLLGCLILLPMGQASCWATEVANLHYAQTGRPGMAFHIQEQHTTPYKSAVLMVKVLDGQHRDPTDTMEFHPYEGTLARAPYLGIMVLICAWLLPLGMLLVTALTVTDFRKSRRQDTLKLTSSSHTEALQ
ncbi:hypothetical protein ACO0LM_07725 [Undibacterium sp. Di26W]|uniref:hypothetical protein n=1 Tax=Undibacterium sp. Di26W TaxID=3413035 RepID=UPI003BF17389